VPTVNAMLARLSIDVVNVDAQLAREAASVRARTQVELPDSYALATALQAATQAGKLHDRHDGRFTASTASVRFVR
jgi:hypothetical protein